MNCLHLIPYMHPNAGGPPVVADQFCHHLVKLGNSATIISTNAYGTGKDGEIETIYRDRGYALQILPKAGPAGFGYSFGLKQALSSAIRKADIVHFHNLWNAMNLFGSRLCRRYKRPYVVSTHGMLDPNSLVRKGWKKGLYWHFLEKPVLDQASGIVFTHPEEARLASSRLTPNANKIVIPLASDLPPANRQTLGFEFLEKHPYLRGKRIILFLGRIHEKKGVDLLVSAFNELANDVGFTDAELVLVGPCEQTYWRHLLAKLDRGCEKRVHWLGSLSGRDKWCAYAAATMFVLPSFQENFALTVVEALVSETPVLLSEHVNIASDLVRQGAASQIYLEIPSIVNEVKVFLADRSLRENLARQGMAYALGQFSWEASARQLCQEYQKLTSESNPITADRQ